MKKDRNCGMNYPVYPNYGPMMPNNMPNMMGGNMSPNMPVIPVGENIEQQINNINNRISNIERKISNLENAALNNSNYNSTGYQMM